MLKVVGLGSCLLCPNLPPYDNNVMNVMMLVVATMIDDDTFSGLRCIFGSHSCSRPWIWLLYVLGLGGHGCWLQLEHWMCHLPENSLGCFWSQCGFIVCACVCAGLFLGSLCVLGVNHTFLFKVMRTLEKVWIRCRQRCHQFPSECLNRILTQGVAGFYLILRYFCAHVEPLKNEGYWGGFAETEYKMLFLFRRTYQVLVTIRQHCQGNTQPIWKQASDHIGTSPDLQSVHTCTPEGRTHAWRRGCYF